MNALKNEICSHGDLICMKHFREEDYSVKNDGRCILKKLVVPTIFISSRQMNIIENSDCSLHTNDDSVVLSCQNCLILEEKLKSQYNKIDEMQRKIESQNQELNDLKERCSNSELVQFALNAACTRNEKVRIYCVSKEMYL